MVSGRKYANSVRPSLTAPQVSRQATDLAMQLEYCDVPFITSACHVYKPYISQDSMQQITTTKLCNTSVEYATIHTQSQNVSYFWLEENFVTDFVPSEMACLASSPGRMRRTAVWISREEIVDFLEYVESSADNTVRGCDGQQDEILTRSLRRDTLEDVVDEGVEDGHRLVRDTRVRVDLLEDCDASNAFNLRPHPRYNSLNVPLYTYVLQVSLRTFLRFFFSPSAPVAAVDLEAVAFLPLASALTGAFEAVVEAGALEAEEAGYDTRLST